MNFTLINNFFQSQISLAAKVLFYFTVLKIIATNYPTSTFALLGAASNLYQVMLMICTMGASSLIVKLFANSTNNKQLFETVTVIFLFSLTAYIILSVVVLSVNYFYKISLVLNINTIIGILILSFAGIIYVFTQSIMNGKSQTLLLNINNLIASILVSIILFSNENLNLDLVIGISAAGYSFVALLLNLYSLRKDLFIPKRTISKSTLLYTFARLLPFIKMGVVAALAYPITLMFIREILLLGNDIQKVGFVDAALQLSIGYSMAIYFYCTQFVFKKATHLHVSNAKPFLLRETYFVAAIGVLYLTFIYLNIENIILVLFSESMRELSNFMLPFILADLIKFIYWPNNFYVLARESTWSFNRAELAFAIVLLISVIFHEYILKTGIETIGYCFLLAHFTKGVLLLGQNNAT